MLDFQVELIQAKQKLVTVRDWLRFAVTSFNKYELYFGHGTTNAYDEAVYLLLASLNLPIEQLEPYLDAKLLDYEIVNLIEMLKKRVINRLPAPYITGIANFQGYQFYVDSRVIIPRSYIIELLNNGQLDQFIEHVELVHNVLDLCTGNGSIAIAAATHYYAASNIIASDIDDAALDVAQINIERYNLDDVITCVKSDLFTNLSEHKRKFDIIFTNPPYVDQARMELLPKEYSHEPQLALAGGVNGLHLIDNILENAKNYLTDFGILIVEMGDNQQELEDKYPTLNFKWLSTTDGHGFVFVLTRSDLN